MINDEAGIIYYHHYAFKRKIHRYHRNHEIQLNKEAIVVRTGASLTHRQNQAGESQNLEAQTQLIGFLHVACEYSDTTRRVCVCVYKQSCGPSLAVLVPSCGGGGSSAGVGVPCLPAVFGAGSVQVKEEEVR